MNANEQIELDLIAPVQGGQNLARLDGQVTFVRGGVAGEQVRAHIVAQKRGYLEAEALSVATPAATRVTPLCPYFGENGAQRGSIAVTSSAAGGVCGGCQYQHLTYQAQLDLKQRVLGDVLRRVGKIVDAPVAVPLPSPTPYAYRNKTHWLINEDGLPSYHEARSHAAVPVQQCDLLIPGLQTLLQTIAAATAELGLAGLARGLEARLLPSVDGREQGTLVLELAASTSRQEAQAMAEALLDLCDSIVGIVGVHGHEAESQTLAGEPIMQVLFLEQHLTLSPTSFFQVNLPVAETMGRYVLEQCRATGRRALDVYCGIGALTIPLAQVAASVIAVELDVGAVADLRGTVAGAALENVTVLPGDAAIGLRAVLPGTVDVAVIDPPRTGCSPDVLRQLARIKAPLLIYVSCDAATLARDLRVLLDSGYVLETIQPFDLFPQTAHTESVTTLRLPRKFQARR